MRTLLPLTTTGKTRNRVHLKTLASIRRTISTAILATLLAGNYTAIVTDKNGSAGVGLVEVYATLLSCHSLEVEFHPPATRPFVATIARAFLARAYCGITSGT